MTTTCIINLKGGVGKTVSAVNMAYILAVSHGKRVLLVDCDKQGNTSKFCGVYDYGKPGLAEVLTEKHFGPGLAVRPWSGSPPGKTGIDVLPSNMNLLTANRTVLLDATRPQQTRMKKALDSLAGQYDHCIIDCAPDINMSVINALVASDHVLVPVKIDKFTFDGLDVLAEQIGELGEFNPKLAILGCFVTMATRNTVTTEGIKWLSEKSDYPVFSTAIRKTVKVDETTFVCRPLLEYARGCTASEDYVALVDEFLEKCH